MKFKFTLIFTAVEAALFIAAPFGAFAFAEARTAAGFRLVFLPLMLFPLACYAAGFITQIKCGFALALPLLTGAVFMPAALLHYGSACEVVGQGYICAIAEAKLTGRIDSEGTKHTGPQIAVGFLQRAESVLVGIEPQRGMVAIRGRDLGRQAVRQPVGQ